VENIFYAGDLLFLQFDHASAIGANAMYVRCVESVEVGKKYAKIITDPFEVLHRITRIEQLIPLPEKLNQDILQYGSAARYVNDSIESWFDEVRSKIMTMTREFLEKHNIAFSQLSEIIGVAKKTSLESSEIVRLPTTVRMLKAFENLMADNKLEPFYEELHLFGRSQFQQFQANIPEGVFVPTYYKQINDLNNYNFSIIAQAVIKQYLTSCKHVVGLLEFEKQKILDGSRKAELSDGWLKQIFTESNQFLLDLGYNFECIPENYIDNPPSDLEAVKKNLTIIEELLDTKQTRYNLREWVTQLSDSIYSRIARFRYHSLTTLAVCFNLEVENLSLDLVKAHMAEHPCSDVQILNLVKDLDYLEKMVQMEETQFRKQGDTQTTKLVLSDVVPISGLIMSSFFRKENVLRTILELFAPKPVVQPPPVAPVSVPKENSELEKDKSSSTDVESSDEKSDESEIQIDIDPGKSADLSELVQRIHDAVNHSQWDLVINLASQAKKMENKEHRASVRRGTGSGAERPTLKKMPHLSVSAKLFNKTELPRATTPKRSDNRDSTWIPTDNYPVPGLLKGASSPNVPESAKPGPS